MDAIDLVCESCGATNRPGTQFCTSCNSYLEWDRTVVQPGPRSAQPAPPVPPTAVQPVYPAADPGYPQQPYNDPAAAYAPDPNWGGQAAYAGPYDQPDPNWGGGYDAQTMPQAGYDPGQVYDASCPNCGTVNDGSLRFCRRCGYGFASSMPAAPGASGFGYNAAASDRAARKAYRRSLPPLYRWRRVLIGVVIGALVITLAVVLRQDPVGLVKSGWYALTRQYVKVLSVQAGVDPPDAAAPQSDPAALVDSSVTEFTLKWQPSAEAACGAAPGTGTMVLRLPATRIRQIQILPGLDKSNPQRSQQPLPRDIGITFDDGVCHPVTLTNADVQPVIKLDSGAPTTTVRIGIGSVYPGGPTAQPLISVTEIVLQSFPS